MSYAELQVTTNLSFLRGASYPDELFVTAAALGIKALGITDWDSLAGIVQAYEVARHTGVRLVVGCRLNLKDGLPVLVYPTDKAAYSRLCRLLTIGKAKAGKGKCELNWQELTEYSEGLIAILVPDQVDEELISNLKRLSFVFGKRAFMALTLRRRPNDALRLHELSQTAFKEGVETVVTNDVLFHLPKRRILQDVISCIREKCTIDKLGFRRERYADRHLKAPEEMTRLFARYPEAIKRTLKIVDICDFSLDQLHYQYPDEIGSSGLSAQELLEKKTWEGAYAFYEEGLSEKVSDQLHHELNLIKKLDYAPYFLTVHHIVSFAKSQNILCQGRGSAANSAVCFVLGITSIDPARHNLLFERFVSQERNEPPDIDVDFDSDRREEVIQWIYKTYGLRHAALTAVVIRYRTKAAIRDVGKALGLPEDVIGIISGIVWPWGSDPLIETQLEGLNLNLKDRRLRLALHLAHELKGFPRHLSQHPGGFVLTRDRLDDLVPIEPATMDDRQVIEWDKDDIDILKFMKVDILGLGMLGGLSRSFDYLRDYKSLDLTLANVPAEDQTVYDMICKADTIGVFQIESRAQMSMLPRLKPRNYYDLVIEVSLVRPGPIQGDMVHPYLRRREGLEKADMPTPELREILGKTLGVPLFQEQAMSIAIKCAGFTPSEADQLRRAMATFKKTGGVTHFKEKFIQGMLSRGYRLEFAQRCFRQIEGFGSYGFPESHAASFAILAYISSWMKCHHPEIFCCALLNSQPMGFYQPAQLVQDARQHGVEIRPVDINYSAWDSTLEPKDGAHLALRLGMHMVGGLHNEAAAKIVAARGLWPYETLDEVWLRSMAPVSALQSLADADAYGSLRLSRREALWAVKGFAEKPMPLFAGLDPNSRPLPEIVEQPVLLRQMSEGEEVVEDYRHIGLTLRHHPLSFIRDKIAERRCGPISLIKTAPNGRTLTIAGLVLVRQRPGTAKGVLFMTIEDETGHANLIVWPDLFEKQRRLLLSSQMIACKGKLQRQGQVIHLVAKEFFDYSDLLHQISDVPGEMKGRTQSSQIPELDFTSRNFC